MAAVTLRAPAKLNLHLGIYAQLDERGYHRADSLMVALDLCDEVRVELLEGACTPQVECVPAIDVPPERNTVYCAAVELAKRMGREPAVRIQVQKRVPDQAGMGGSSSDAAAVIRALCQLWGEDVQSPEATDAARAVGADVPFFLDPVPTLLVGAGDVVAEKFPALREPVSVALVRPAGPGVSTPAAYAAFDEEHEEPADPGALCDVLRRGEADAKTLAGLLANNLDPVACRLLPAVAEVRSWLLAQDETLGGQVTGSGSCVFAVCESDEAAERIVQAAKKRFGCWTMSAHIS